MWKKIRIAVLTFILTVVALQAWVEQADLSWEDNFHVAIYPVNADGSKQVSEYLRTLTRDDFKAMEEYFVEAAAPFNLGVSKPVEVQLGAQLWDIPPAPPSEINTLNNIIWSLKFRLFAWFNNPIVGNKPVIRLYLLYYDPNTNPVLSYSATLNKGRIGRVNLFGEKSYNKQNLVVVAHELLHTLSATDKYDLENGHPIYPVGYAEPHKMPRYPQDLAELMGGYVPVSAERSDVPMSLKHTIIGEETAREIGWLTTKNHDQYLTFKISAKNKRL